MVAIFSPANIKIYSLMYNIHQIKDGIALSHPDTGPGNIVLNAGIARIIKKSVPHPIMDIMSLEIDATIKASAVTNVENKNRAAIIKNVF